MTDAHNCAADSIESLVAALPEKYQPIFGHPELSDGSSRDCEDRLERILAIAERLKQVLGRPLRVLDLGCAQGFFSLNLAAAGHSVHGADFLDRNVHVCSALAKEAGLNKATFECARIEDIAGALQMGAFDLVLGLSVFHHLVHEHGLAPVVEIISGIASKVACGIYEVAVREEPLYWASSQPEHPVQLLAPYAFQRVMSWQPTHLSGVERPFYFVSNQYWFVGNDFRSFDAWQFQSHSKDMDSHQQSRRYFFAGDVMLKQYSLANAARGKFNREEYENEARFLAGAPAAMDAPALIEAVVDREDCWLVRTMLQGRLLLEMMAEHVPYSQERVADGLIRQLVVLEEAGFYHNDVRCWNLLVGEDSKPSLIDFGAISQARNDCVWPGDPLVSLLITIREIFMGHVGQVLPVRRGLLDVGMLPMRFQAAFAYALSQPQGGWSFAVLADRMDRWAGESVEFPGYVTAMAAAERGMLIFEGTLAAEMHDGRLVRAELARVRDDVDAKLAAERRECDLVRVELDRWREEAQRWRLLVAERDVEIASLHDRQMSTVVSQGALQRQMESLSSKLAMQEADVRTMQEADARRREAESALYDENVRQREAESSAVMQSLQDWQARAQELDAALLRVRKSWSWRLTLPFRGIVYLLREPVAFTRRVVLALMRRMARHPTLARELSAAVRLVPPLHAKIMSVAVNNQIIAKVPEAVEHEGVIGEVGSFAGLTEREGLERLSIRGQSFYRDIAGGERKENN